MQMKEQKSLPPMAIVTIFQSYLKLTLLSCFILFIKDLALEKKTKKKHEGLNLEDVMRIFFYFTMNGISAETAEKVKFNV